MPAPGRLTVLAGERPLVLVAPHGGRRDPARRPWAGGHLRMNDLHTAALTAELAALTGATALINAEADRNDVDLNRIGEAHGGAPWFLERLAAVVEAVLARHGRATLFSMHGWNVVQPVLDLGLGCAPGEDPFLVGPAAAVTPKFAATAVASLVTACRTRGIGATVGARYPARHRENLLQLFTPRYCEDPRPLVRALAAAAPSVDAVQLELGIALRWPGRWRRRFLDACVAALPALLLRADRDDPTAEPASIAASAPAVRLEFTAAGLCGLVGLDAGRGGRLLLFPPDGGLALFTGERLGLEPAGTAGRLRIRRANGRVAVRFCGPLLRFPDTLPFLDLEAGLARARLVDARVALDLVPHHAAGPSADFGALTGSVVLDGTRHAVVGEGFAEDGTAPGPWPRLRGAIRIDERTRVALSLGLDGGEASGFVCRDGHHVAVAAGRATIASAHAPLERVTVDLALADGERLRITAHAIRRLPVIRARGATPVRIEFAACGLDGQPSPAGWFEAGGL